MNRPDLFALVGQRVTVTNPNGSASWTGKLAAVGTEPCVVIAQDHGPRLCLPQSYTVTPAEPPEPLAPWEEEILDQQATVIQRENTLVERLDRALANLDRHIEQRAQELAQPLIYDAREAAATEVKTAQDKQQRSEDLVAELCRQLRALERQLTDQRQRVENVRAHLNRNLAGLVGKSGYEVGYRSCAEEVTYILDTPVKLKEPDRG